MPTYHFRCDQCQHEVDQKMPFGSTETPLCTTCNLSMKKYIVPPHVHFKGGGFYKTDAEAKQKSTTSGTTPTVPPSSPSPS